MMLLDAGGISGNLEVNRCPLPGDGGQYSCEADNGIGGPSSAHFLLTVQCKYFI